MPADYDELFTAFADLTGSTDSVRVYSDAPGYAGGPDEWIDLFQTTGIDFQSHDATVEAFENFLLAFYPQIDKSGDEWWYDREEFFEMYGIDERDIDWEAYREAIGYGRT